MSKRFGGTLALDAVDLAVRPGSVHALLGRNGAGKSTLLGVLFGLVCPDAGAVSLLGQPVGGWRGRGQPDGGWRGRGRPVAAWRPPVAVGGWVGVPRFWPGLTGRRVLEVLTALDGGGADRISGVLDRVGLAESGSTRVGAYSTGMRQRLALASALVREPRLLVLDEPATGLDPAGLRDLRDLLRAYAAAGGAVLLSSHDLAQVEAVSDTVTVLHRGRVRFAGSLADLRAKAPDPAVLLHTSDDRTALSRAADLAPVAADPDGFEIRADQATLDAYVVGLGRSGIAVRSLVPRRTPLEDLFLDLTQDPVPAAGGTASGGAAGGSAAAGSAAGESAAGVDAA